MNVSYTLSTKRCYHLKGTRDDFDFMDLVVNALFSCVSITASEYHYKQAPQILY